jgi:cell division protease FtsH
MADAPEPNRFKVEPSPDGRGAGKKPEKRNFMRPGFLTVVIVLLAVNYLLLNVLSPKPPVATIPYSPYFLDQVNGGNVERISPIGESVTGEFKAAVRYPNAKAEKTKNFETQIPAFADSPKLEALLRDKHVIIDAKAIDPGRGVLLSILLGFGPVLLLIFLFVSMARRAGGGGLNPLGGFGRSRARRVEGGDQRVTFADVAGIDEAKAELLEVVDFLRNPHRYQRLGGRIPRGVLLAGQPGTGKTLLARAVAGEAGAPFFSISASEVVEAIVGVGASRVRDLFKTAKEAAPAIIFIDELDAVGRARSGGAGFGTGGNDEREQTLNQILTEMDGFESNVAVIVLGATNRPEILDAALLRPGRFDRRIAVPPPDREGRAQILAVHTRSLPLDGDVSLDQLAATTPGMVGADLANLANEAALTAARRGHEKVEMSDFTDAMEKIVLGSPRGTVLSDDERRRVAYHEAGHALVGMLTPGADPVRKVSIIPRGQALGVTFAAPDDDRSNYEESWLLAKIDVALGGRVAEEVVFGTITTGAESDIQQLTQIARGMVGRWGMSRDIGPIAVLPQEGNGMLLPGADQPSETTQRRVDDEVRRIVEEAHARVTRLLTERREQLDALTNALLADETLDEEAAYRAAQVTRGAADMSPEERNFPADARL